MDDVLISIADAMGVPHGAMAVLLPLTILILNLIGRAIPDDATGWKAVARKISKVGGLYLSNRVTSGVSVNDVVRDVANVESK